MKWKKSINGKLTKQRAYGNSIDLFVMFTTKQKMTMFDSEG